MHIVSSNAVVLKLPPSFEVDAPINVSWLHPYKPPTILGQQIMLQPPVEVEGEEEYVVEEILDSCLRHNKLEFLVKWEGYTNENNLWEPEDNCSNAHNAVACTLLYPHHKSSLVNTLAFPTLSIISEIKGNG